MKCSTRKCPSPAVHLCTWGPPTEPEQYNRVPFCARCFDQLWDQIYRLVNKGVIDYRCEAVPSTEQEKGL